MTPSGWIFLILSWGSILSLAIFCFSRILRKGLGDNGAGKISPRSKRGQGKE